MIISEQDLTALWVTIKLASVSTLVLLIIGTPIAWWLSRSQWRFKFIIEAIIALPLILPPTVLGFYLREAPDAGGRDPRINSDQLIDQQERWTVRQQVDRSGQVTHEGILPVRGVCVMVLAGMGSIFITLTMPGRDDARLASEPGINQYSAVRRIS